MPPHLYIQSTIGTGLEAKKTPISPKISNFNVSRTKLYYHLQTEGSESSMKNSVSSERLVTKGCCFHFNIQVLTTYSPHFAHKALLATQINRQI